MEKKDIKALFLGPKSENHKFFKDTLNSLMDEHIFWRRDFHPDDKSFVSHSEQRAEGFCSSMDRVQEVLYELSNKLKTNSMPWFSTRYMGHMNTDILLPAVLGYMTGILYNPNNCAYEGAPATTHMELEVGKQIGIMMGFDPEATWGHITSGGTVANIEGLWYARNIKSIPFAINKLLPEVTKKYGVSELNHLSISTILDMLDTVSELGRYKEVLNNSARGKGSTVLKNAKVLVPQTRHYSWNKAVDILGIGSENLIQVKVKENYRMDIDELESTLSELFKNNIPVIAVVAVIGTTEEGAVDDIHRIVEIKKNFAKQGFNFYFHIDAAYGGYARSIFLDSNGSFMSYQKMKKTLLSGNIINEKTDWPSKSVYKSFKTIPEADSITVDCHKLGYIPYPAGAVTLKDKRILKILGYQAAYVDGADDPVQLGPFILEGSKAGSSAASVWAAHEAVPLNVSGYGKIIGCSINAASSFYRWLRITEPFVASNGKTYTVRPLAKPDINIVVFAFNELNNKNLSKMNAINENIYNKCSYVSGPVYHKKFITSKTVLTREEYGNAPASFIGKFDIPEDEWEAVGAVYVLRACIMSPFMSDSDDEIVWNRLINIMKDVIAE